ncbi:DUF2478 domain-containing protein [Labrys sp. KNU-23]|uniref:DUF2478 domain-containing protein n=1 Tax=unclassified Labrys (in: a-proteobacteria) TaxID=2688601 RepID=UPI0011ECCDCB|nr:DUF2478 domain-containing protein [Labrys sp. KNU-23]QEN84730.1 DUF2478 domain-containing protein [Labrys sp. KNU-23]
MLFVHPDYAITGIVYSSGSEFEIFLRDIVGQMAQTGLRLAGLIQHSQPKPGRAKCDMFLHDLATGGLHPISDDRGPEARGCVLNPDRLLRACDAAMAGLGGETDILVLCKFGKAEVEGGGFRTLMASALELGVPVLIGVPLVNLAAFRQFAGDLACVVDMSEPEGCRPPVAQSPWPGGGPTDRPLAGAA